MNIRTVPLRYVVLLVALMLSGGAGVISGEWQSASTRAEHEERRERLQRVGDIYRALDVRPGATIADIGAGQGFHTVRLARAVGVAGRVLAVDISTSALEQLRRRVAEEGLTNVSVIEGAVDDPRLPEGTLDAVLIVNSYHEMTEYAAMLQHIRRALKPDGRLVIVEPIAASRRSADRTEQTSRHEIAPALVLEDAREAGFRVLGLEDPFTAHQRPYWLAIFGRQDAAPFSPSEYEHVHDDDGRPEDPRRLSRITIEEFVALRTAGPVTVLDVRDGAMFTRGRINGARLAPMSALRDLVGELKGQSTPIVTYCSCPAEETSGRAVLYLERHGVSGARALVGGYEGWVAAAAGHSVVTGK